MGTAGKSIDLLEAPQGSERDYRSLFEYSNDAILIFEPEQTNILEANRKACDLYGLQPTQLIGTSLRSLAQADAFSPARIRSVLEKGRDSGYEAVQQRCDGTPVYLVIESFAIEYGGRRAVLSMHRDVSDTKRAETEIARLLRALTALRRCNQALVQAADEPALLNEICRIIAEDGGYRMVWVGRAEHDERKSIQPVAWFGARLLARLERAAFTWANDTSNNGAVGTAIRTGQPCLLEDGAREPKLSPWAASALGDERGPVLSLPLYVAGQIWGALTMKAPESRAFDAKEIDLLKELASDVSYGISALRAEAQRQQAEQELRASETLYRNLIETANEGILVLDAEWRTTLVNARMAEMLGCKPEAIIGRPVYDFIPPEKRALAESGFCQSRQVKRAQLEHWLEGPDGKRTYFLLSAAPLFDTGGRYAGAVAMFTDITDRKHAEDELRASEQRYRLLFECNLAGVCRTNVEGEILECNEAFCRIFGYDAPHELHRIPIANLHKDPSQRERNVSLLLEQGKIVNHEVEMLRKDNMPIVVILNLSVLRDKAGVPIWIEGAIVDITETRQLQRELLQSQKMEAIGRLAGGIAHDFNNLLMVIRSYSELLLETLADERQRHYAEQVVKTANRAADLTRQMLAFSRKQVMVREILDLNDVVREAGKILPRLIGENIEVNLVLTSDLARARADRTQLQQVIMNLAVNARDAMSRGGRLSLETAVIELDADYCARHGTIAAGSYVLLAVSDTGSGIDAAVLPHIFEPFFTTKERGKGTGLGLSTVYGIVQQSGGRILVYSEIGRGTTFKIYLPRVKEGGEVLAASAVGAPVQAAGSGTILLVEDEAALREAAAGFLAARGYRVLQAGDGQQALAMERSAESEVELLITDVVLPGIMSGPELAKQLLQLRPGLSVLYMSGYTETTTLENEQLDLTMHFLQKPFGFQLLAKRVQEILQSRPTREAA